MSAAQDVWKEAGQRDRKSRRHRELPEGPVALGPVGERAGSVRTLGTEDRSVSRCSRRRGSYLSSP